MAALALAPTAAAHQDRPPRPAYQPTWEFVTPDVAAAYLAINHERNRNVRKRWVNDLDDELRSGRYIPTHQGIAFDEDGRLADGQHRLLAIVSSGVGCWLLITRGLPREAILAIDLHARRQAQDQIGMLDDDIRPTTTDVSIARAMIGGAATNGGSCGSTVMPGELHPFLRRHWEAIRFSTRHMESRRVGLAPIRAAAARASYYLDHGRLLDFMRVLDTQLANGPRDHAAVMFRKWLDDPSNRHLTGGGRGSRAAIYGLTVAYIQAFFRGLRGVGVKPITHDADPFPLPE